MMKYFLLLSTVLFYSLQVINAQSGELDQSFGKNGIVKTNIGPPAETNGRGQQVLVHSDGSVYILLNYPTLVTKRLLNGSIDLSYGIEGFSKGIQTDNAHAALQADGKIVIAGTNNDQSYVTRLNTNGMYDSSFGTNGLQNAGFPGKSSVSSVTIQKDGKIIIAGAAIDNETGSSYFAVARFNTDGSPDQTFNANGQVITNFGTDPDYNEAAANAVAIQENNKIVVAGYTITSSGETDFALIRYNTDGSIDSTFSNDGKQTANFSDDFGYSLAIQKDGKIVLAGLANNNFAVARFNVNGTLDNSFSDDGKRTFNIGSDGQMPNSVVIQDDKIIIAGYTLNNVSGDNDFAVIRLNINGSLDNSFDQDGILTTDFNSYNDQAGSVAIQNDNKILVAGYSYNTIQNKYTERLTVSRYNLNGSLDNSFNNDGKLEGAASQGDTKFFTSALQSDGKLLAAGQAWNGNNYDIAITRYHPNGNIDSTFGNNGMQLTDFGGDLDIAYSMAIQKDGKIVVAGSDESNSQFSTPQFIIARYNANGKLDSSFSADGKVAVSFGFASICQSVALQSNGKIVVSGYTYSDNFDNAEFAVARLNTNGTLDNTFSQDGKQVTDINSSEDFAASVIIQKDEKILVAGRSVLNSKNNFSLVRYNTNGSLDTSFSNNGKQNNIFGLGDYYGKSLAVQSDGKILLGGYSVEPDFSQPNFFGRYSFAVARYNANGDTDSSFSTDGFQTAHLHPAFNFASSIAITNKGRIVLGGVVGNADVTDNFAIVLYRNNGSFDATFSNDGIQISDVALGGSSLKNLIFTGNNLYATGYGQFPGNFGVVAKYLFDDEAGTAPTVSLTKPAHDTAYIGPLNINLAATAADADGTISKVELYNGETLLATERKLPYAWTWKNVPVGQYTLTAKAYDNDSLVTTSAPVHITVVLNKPPVISIKTTVESAKYLTPATVVIKASASDADGKIKKVEFYNGETLLGTDKYAGYGWHWNNVPPGEYTLTAKAYDNYGDVSTSSPVHITVAVNKAPSVSIIKPSNNQTYTGPATINLEASAKDQDGTISKVEFYNGSKLLVTERKVPYTFSWKNVSPGDYAITAKATDDYGDETTSTVVHISVVPNKAPTVSLISPADEENFTVSSTINMRALAKDNDGKISKVEFYNGATLLHAEKYAPYTWQWKDVPAGKYIITAKATDNMGEETVSEPVKITVEEQEAQLARRNPQDASKANINAAISLRLSPNPTRNIINISAQGLERNQPVTISVISSRGAIIKTLRSSVSTQTLDVSALTKGVYTIRMLSGDRYVYRKFIKL